MGADLAATLSAAVGLSCGVAIGVVLAHVSSVVANPYARWLEKECWVRPCGREVWRPCVVVAVSWHGAVCVRELTRQDERGYWIQKENVAWRVRFERPADAEDVGAL